MRFILTYRAQAGCEMGDEVVSEVGSAEEETLDLVIEAQLTNGHQNLTFHNSRHASDSHM